MIKLDWIDVQAISLLHDGGGFEDVQHFAYAFTAGGKQVVHVGDAKPQEENYRNLKFSLKEIDLLIVPFPYVGITPGIRIYFVFIISGEKTPILYRWRDESPAPNTNTSSQNTCSMVKYRLKVCLEMG